MKKKHEYLFIFGLIVVLFVIYSHTLHYDLIWDSKDLVERNILLKENSSFLSAFERGFFYDAAGIKSQDFYYRPVTMLVYILESRIWGLTSSHLRLTNIFLFSLLILSLYLFLKRLPENRLFPEFTVVLFALYPLNIDNIVWVVGRGDLLFLLWGILTLFCFEFYRRDKNKWFLLLSGFFYLLGIFSKESFLVFFFILIVYEWIRGKRLTFLYHGANLVMTLAFFIIKLKVVGIPNLSMVFPSDLLLIVKKILVVMGYYFKVLIFPFSFDKFALEKDIFSWSYILLGFGFILFLMAVLYKSIKDRILLLPLSFMVLSLALHVGLSFTLMQPFKLSARYLMLGAIGFTWIVVKLVGFLARKYQFLALSLIALLLVPSIFLNSRAYKNEIHFWQRAKGSFPGNVFFTYSLANAHFKAKNHLEAEALLRKVVEKKLNRREKVTIFTLSASIEYVKAEYGKSWAWINRTKQLFLYPIEKFEVNLVASSILISRGDVVLAETLLKKTIREFPEKRELYQKLYDMYLGLNLWKKALEMEHLLNEKFQLTVSVDSVGLEKKFDSLPERDKIDFYIKYQNYGQALNVLHGIYDEGIEDTLTMVFLLYMIDQEKKAEMFLNRFLLPHQKNYKIINTAGLFYFKKIIRPVKACFYFRESLRINQDQPEIVSLLKFFEERYTELLKDTHIKSND